jgi:DNA polymerase III epsilon subunit-like protein
MNTPYYLVIDTETTGLPIRDGTRTPSYKKLDRWDSCRLVQIAWVIYTQDGIEHQRKELLVKPNGFIIENGDFHGISHKAASERGIPVEDVLEELSKDLQMVKVLVGHNLESFDVPLLKSEAHRLNVTGTIKKLQAIPKECTRKMASSRGLPQKLSVLHERCIGSPPHRCHNAMDDVEACARIFFLLKREQKTSENKGFADREAYGSGDQATAAIGADAQACTDGGRHRLPSYE